MRNSRRGSSILEVALVLPVMMITLVAIGDLGRYIYATNLMPFLAREGARWASLEANRSSARLDQRTVSQYVRSLAAGLPTDSVKVETALRPEVIAVNVSLRFEPVLNVFGGPITVRGHASMARSGAQSGAETAAETAAETGPGHPLPYGRGSSGH